MLYLGIDQHARQITVSLRDENGDVIEARQFSTKPEKIHDFFQRLTAERLKAGEKFVAVLEVCGFNEWLIRMLRDDRCHKVILIQPEQRTKRKTDRRDAAALSELLWVRWLLAQVTINVLRKDACLREWFKRIKRKRGSKIARVAVMRKLATIIWHMLSRNGGINLYTAVRRQLQRRGRSAPISPPRREFGPKRVLLLTASN